MSKDLYVTGHPRSGNTWLCRLLSYILYAPIEPDGGYWGEEAQRDEYVIQKTHSVEKLPGPTVFIYRDPRDAVVSMWHYRTENKSIREVIEKMASPEFNPASDRYGKYDNFVRSWWNTGRADAQVRYEDLHINPIGALQKTTYALTKLKISSQHISNATFWLEFSALKARKAPLLDHSMWKGKIGAWREYFTNIEADLCQKYWGDLMLEQGYITGPEWVHEVRMK